MLNVLKSHDSSMRTRVTDEIDDAFNYLVVILSIIAGALSQFPEIFPFSFAIQTPLGIAIGFVRILFLPIIVLVFVWLWSYLARETEHKVVLKSLSWILASIIMFYQLIILFAGIYFSGATGVQPQENPLGFIVALLILVSPLFLSPILYVSAIRPRLREIHKDSKFLVNTSQQVLLYIVAVLLNFLANGVIESALLDIFT